MNRNYNKLLSIQFTSDNPVRFISFPYLIQSSLCNHGNFQQSVLIILVSAYLHVDKKYNVELFFILPLLL